MFEHPKYAFLTNKTHWYTLEPWITKTEFFANIASKILYDIALLVWIPWYRIIWINGQVSIGGLILRISLVDISFLTLFLSNHDFGGKRNEGVPNDHCIV